jgi:hypothetical protein
VTPHLQKRPGELNCRRLPKIAAGWHDLSREDFLLGFGAIQLAWQHRLRVLPVMIIAVSRQWRLNWRYDEIPDRVPATPMELYKRSCSP